MRIFKQQNYFNWLDCVCSSMNTVMLKYNRGQNTQLMWIWFNYLKSFEIKKIILQLQQKTFTFKINQEAVVITMEKLEINVGENWFKIFFSTFLDHIHQQHSFSCFTWRLGIMKGHEEWNISSIIEYWI